MRYLVEYAGKRLHDVDSGRFVTDFSGHLEAGSPGSVSFKVPWGHPLHDLAFRADDPTAEVVVSQDGCELFRGPVTSVSTDMDGNVGIEAQGQLRYLSDVRVRPYATCDAGDVDVATEYVAGDLMEWIVAEYNRRALPDKRFRIGLNPHARARRVATDYPTALEELNAALCDGQDRYLNARTGINGERYLDILDGGAGDGTQAIVLGENVIDIQTDRDAGDVVTAIIARGRLPEAEEAPDDGDFVESAEGTEPDEPETVPSADDETADTGRYYDREATTFGLETLTTGATYTVGDVAMTVDGDRLLCTRLVALYGVREEMREYEAASPQQLLECVAADFGGAESREIVSVDVAAIDLYATNPDIQPIRLLDWNRVFAPRLGTDAWLPCSKVELTLDPATTVYHFGDIPATLTRQSALRMGQARKGTGNLIRRAQGAAWNTDRAWDRAEDAYKEADEAKRDLNDFKADQGEENGSLTAGLDNLILWYTEMGGDLDQLEAYMRGEVGRIDDDLVDGVGEAIAAAQRTQFGVCGTASSNTAKAVTVSVPGDDEGRYPFKLVEGAVVTVKFTFANARSNVTLNVNDSGARYIVTNGAQEAFWDDGATARFVYDGSAWQNCSVPVFASKLTVGNPGQANLYTDGKKMQMRIGDIDYCNVDIDGVRVGASGSGYSHALVDSDGFHVAPKYGAALDIVKDKTGSGAEISCKEGLLLDNCQDIEATTYAGLLLSSASGMAHLSGFDASLRAVGTVFLTSKAGQIFLGKDGNTGGYLRTASVVLRADGDEVTISKSQVGMGPAYGFSGYVWVAENGDIGSYPFYVVGTQCNASTLKVKLDRSVAGNIRLNILGFPILSRSFVEDAPMPGPEIFDDAGAAEGPSSAGEGEEAA